MTNRLIAVAGVLVLLLAGCSSQTDQLEQARGEAIAAVGGVILALDVAPGVTPPGVVSTGIDDALREVRDAGETVLQLQPADAGTREKRSELLAAIRDAEDALAAARDDPEAGADALAAVRDELKAAG